MANSLTGGAIWPQQLQPVWPGLQSAFGQWLFGQMGQGLPKYQGALSPNMNQTVLPALHENWNAFNINSPGYQYLGQYLRGKGPMQGYIDSGLTQGGPGGLGTQLMQQMASQGGVNGPGTQGMMSLMNMGVASPGSGGPLASMAYGGGPALNMLAPFLSMGMQGYQTPQIPGGK